MLTPQEIHDTGFRKAVFGGYVAEDVDEFLEIVVEDYEELYAENAVLKRKIKMLVDKIEEHRASEESVRTTLANAQKKSEDMYRETREKCRRLTRDTDEKAKKTISDAQMKVMAEERRLSNLCANVEQFVSAVQKVIDKQNENLKELTSAVADVRAKNPKRPVEKKTSNKAPESISQPKIDFNDNADTETAEKINEIVSKIMNENEPAKAEMAAK